MSSTNEDSLPGRQASNGAHSEDARLETQRWQVQKEITTLIRGENFGQKLQEKKILYNEVVTALHEHQIGPRADPMDRLPHELIRQILLEFVLHETDWGTMEEILVLTMVSKKWQNAILSEPNLWNYIVLDNGNENPDLVALQVRLSIPLLLTVRVHLPFERCDTVRPELFESRKRIQKIIFDFEYLPGDDNDNRKATGLWTFLDTLGPLPSLRYLSDTWMDYWSPFDIKKLLNQYSSLEQVTNIPLTSQDLHLAGGRLNLVIFRCSLRRLGR
jgi:hypothetical protein